jgi:hypothetical protein
MKRMIEAVFLAAIASNAVAQAGGAAQGARPATSAPNRAEERASVLLAGVVAAIIANNSSSSHTSSNH